MSMRGFSYLFGMIGPFYLLLIIKQTLLYNVYIITNVNRVCLVIMNISDEFWNASLEDVKRGYIQHTYEYRCLLCEHKTEKGVIYPEEGFFYDAERSMRHHIENVHQSVFEHLIELDKKWTGLTDHQNALLRLFYQGKSDAEVQKEMDIGSASTIRNHRFVLKEKERQSKVFLVLMELLKERDKHQPAYASHPQSEGVKQHRYDVSQQEREKILKKYFPDGADGPLSAFSKREKHKLVVLEEIAKRFEKDRIYNEKEINQILQDAYHDYVMLRRYLIDFGFLDRKPDGSQYWLKKDGMGEDGKQMNRKEELKQLYKETKVEAGVYQIKNTKNQKVFIGSTRNLKTLNGQQFTLRMGSHINKSLQEEWNEYGEDTFSIEVLEILKEKEDGYFDVKDALKKLEEKWMEKLQPYGDRGYHQLKK